MWIKPRDSGWTVFSTGLPRGFIHGFWHFAKKFLEKGVFFFASFLLDEQKK
ncbi:hypothetical protein [Salegentibacter salegens]|uniref:hypothetical protein n=1 Tax=Salegentibacter salegens TaxID=143223 RepID=UPI0012AB6A05|nr:hypothetical protein [Salegentibacter salegens]